MTKPATDHPQTTPAVLKDLALKAGVGITAASLANPYVGAMVALAPDACKAMLTVLRDMVLRPESPRRSRRSLLATECILKGISERLQTGDRLREDEFFDKDVDRSKAEEVYEAVLDACIKQFEEKKIPHIAKIYEVAVFSDIPPSTVNSLLQQASEKTWRHYCLLSLLANENSARAVSDFFAVEETDLDPHSDEPHLRADLERLHGRATGLITESNGRLKLSLNGRLFVDCAGLALIDDDEVRSIERTMRSTVASKRPIVGD